MQEETPRDVLYIGIFRVKGEEDSVAAVHRAWIEFIKERGLPGPPGEVMVWETPPMSLVPEPKGVMKWVRDGLEEDAAFSATDPR